MARISTYQRDTVVTKNDKVIGSDSAGSITKNFKLEDLANFFSSAITVGGQTAYQFVTTRAASTLTEPADNSSFSSLSTFKVSEIDAAGHNIEDFLLEYAGRTIVITQVDNKNNFGFFEVSTVIEDPNNLNYYDFTVLHLSSNGNLALNKYYTITIAGGDDKHFAHSQNQASNEWVINHNLNKFPSVSVAISSGQQGFADVTYNDKNTLTINFSGAETGKAYLN